MHRKYISQLTALVVTTLSSASQAQEIDARDIYPSRPLIKSDPWITNFNPSVDTKFSTGFDLGPLITDDVFADVGRGYNPITNKILSPVCVEGTEPDHKLGNGTIPRSSIGVVEDVKAHQKASSSSVGFSAIIKGAQIGFGASEARGEYFNSVEKFARIFSRVATVGIERRNVKWHKDAADWIENDPKKFIEQCGTHYVRAVFKGHLLDMWVRFTLNEDQQALADAKALNVGVPKIFGASMGSSDAEASVTRHATAKLDSHGLGAFALPAAPNTLPPSDGGVGASAGAEAGAKPPATDKPTDGAEKPADGAVKPSETKPSEPQQLASPETPPPHPSLLHSFNR